MNEQDLSKYWVDLETPYINDDKVQELIVEAYKKGFLDGGMEVINGRSPQ